MTTFLSMGLRSIVPVVALLCVTQLAQGAETPKKGSVSSALQQIPFGEVAPFPGAFAISADGSTAAHIAKTGDVLVWDPLKTVLLETIPAHGRMPGAIALSADGQRIAIGYFDSKVALWSRRERKVAAGFSGHRRSISALAFSPDGRWLASGSADGTTRLWELASGQQARIFDSMFEQMNGGTVVALGFSGDGRVLVVNEWYSFHYDVDRGVTLWDIADGIEISTRDGTAPNTSEEMRAGQALGGNGWLLAYASADAFMVERLDQCGPARPLTPGRSSDTVAVDPQGRWAAITYDEQLVFSATSGDTKPHTVALPARGAISVVPHPDGRSVFALMTNASNAGYTYFVPDREDGAALTGSPIYRIPVPQPLVALAPMATSADAGHCAPSEAARIKQDFRVPGTPAELKLTAQLMMATPEPVNPPREIYFSGDGKLYALHEDDSDLRGGVVVWNPKTKTPLRARFKKRITDPTLRLREGWAERSEALRDLLTGKEIVPFVPDGRWKPVADPDTGEVYLPANGHFERYAPDGKRAQNIVANGKISSFTARNGRLAALYANGSVQVWNMQAPGEPKTYQTGATLDEEICVVDSVTLSADGHYLQVPMECGDTDTMYSIYRLGMEKDIAAGPLLAPFPARANRGVVADTRPHHLAVWDFDAGDIIARLPRHESIDADGSNVRLRVAISDDGRLLASASTDGLVRVWNLDTRQMLGNAHIGTKVLSMAFDPAAGSLAVGANDGKIYVFEIPARK